MVYFTQDCGVGKWLGIFLDTSREYIIVVAPHTSNWDFPFGILLRIIRNVDVKFIGKSSLFRPPFGRLLGPWGAIRWIAAKAITL